jgi:hypothetical protein
MQTPYRFRSKRQLWTYSGLGVETHDSAQHRYVDGQLQRSKKPQQIRGLNQNHNHEMKKIFKSTAVGASRCAGPLQDFYAGLLAKGMKPDMARLTLARKIAAITLTLWKKGERFDAEHLKIASSLSVCRNQTNPGLLTRWLAHRFMRRSGSRVSINQ